MRQVMINFSHRHQETVSDASWSTEPRKINPTDLVECNYESCDIASCSVHCVNGTLKWGMFLDRCHGNKDSILALPAQFNSTPQEPVAEATEDELPPECHPASSWASLMKGPSKNKGFANLVCTPPTVVEGKKILNINSGDFEEDNSIHDQLLVGHFIGRKLAYSYIKATLSALWALKGDLEMTVRRSHFFFKFSNWEDRQNALEHGSQHIASRMFILREWHPFIEYEPIEAKSLPIWVMIHDVPTQYWNQDGIGKIASLIGRPMYTDKATESKRRPFVRVCVEVMATDELPEQVSMIVDGDYTIELAVEYNWVPSRCLHCKLFGHSDSHCGDLEKDLAPEAPRAYTAALNTQKKVWRETQSHQAGKPVREKVVDTTQLPQQATESAQYTEVATTNSNKVSSTDTLNLKSKSDPIGGDYLDEGFQLSKSAMKRLRKSKRKSEKEMRKAEVREPPSKEKYSFSARGQTGSSFHSSKPKATTHKAGGHGSKAKKLNVNKFSNCPKVIRQITNDAYTRLNATIVRAADTARNKEYCGAWHLHPDYVLLKTVLLSWDPPPQGICLLNSDGSYTNSRGGTGGIIRNSEGIGIIAYAGMLEPVDIVLHEMQAILQGLETAVNLGLPRLWVNPDSTCTDKDRSRRLLRQLLKNAYMRGKESGVHQGCWGLAATVLVLSYRGVLTNSEDIPNTVKAGNQLLTKERECLFKECFGAGATNPRKVTYIARNTST
ncbi:hypothetical protein GIB67_035740 [Kingdonia uniflora]|uniref:DUF4283 domain-containing protein n=1 Tax=Kingdonia uniflora TaxID=39325 RepID=A0A7J7MJC4_9MAGN|nr:hypothetical protein GIB67_035740 [Kingdonia uniflora]